MKATTSDNYTYNLLLLIKVGTVAKNNLHDQTNMIDHPKVS